MNHPAGRAGVQRNIRVFLQGLAAGGRKPIEQMTPREARGVLEGLQSNVKVDLSTLPDGPSAVRGRP